MIRTVVVLLLHWLSLGAWPGIAVLAQSQGFPVPETIAAKQGLPQGFVPAIVQDKRGFMWLATRDGLCRYDGRHFRVFQPSDSGEPSISSLGLENLQTAADGKIWIASDQGHIDLFDPAGETFLHFSAQEFYQKHFGKRFLRNMFADSQQRLWLMSDGRGVAYVHAAKNIVKKYEPTAEDSSGIRRTRVRFVSEDRAGTIWAGTNEGIFLLRRNAGDFVKYPLTSPVLTAIETKVRALEQLRSGRLLLLFDTGMALLDPVTGQCSQYPLIFDTKAQYRHPIVTDSKGNAYFFRMNGLYRLGADDSLAVFPVEADVQEFKSLYIDRSDVLWAGTNGQGIRKYNLRASYFNTKPYVNGFVADLLRYFLNVPQKEVDQLPSDLFS